MLRAGFEIYSEGIREIYKILRIQAIDLGVYSIFAGEPEFDVEKTVEEIKSSYGDSILILGLQMKRKWLIYMLS